jgi:hypothetical protein
MAESHTSGKMADSGLRRDDKFDHVPDDHILLAGDFNQDIPLGQSGILDE